jgi:hypothetical protein
MAVRLCCILTSKLRLTSYFDHIIPMRSPDSSFIIYSFLLCSHMPDLPLTTTDRPAASTGACHYENIHSPPHVHTFGGYQPNYFPEILLYLLYVLLDLSP